ncbi:MAG: DegQ family serine endoprotease [Gammaproteobacteria bacterium]|nr:DegQ family serine endoprotease [Gammaproteobacteria bacterium]
MFKLMAAGLLAAVLLLAGQDVAARELPEFTDLVEEYSSAVVNVSTRRARRESPTMRRFGAPDELEEFFRRYFPNPGEPPGPRGPRGSRQSLGSGFVISRDGYVLTNNHVVEGADEIVVRLIDRRELTAELIGADPRSDLALLKVDATDLPTVQIGNSKSLKVGEWVLAIGSPFGFDYSVTAGIVSAKGRSLPTENGDNYVPFIQTDVAINPGNSGGPLFNLDGEVVGINSQIYTRSGGFMGVSFAIPIDVAMEVVEQLKADGRVSRGWLGVMIQEVDRNLAESFGLDKPSGALVADVVPGSPAEASGLQAGDIIVEFDGTDIDRSADLPHLVGRTRVGSTTELGVVRGGDRIIVEVVIGELSDAQGRQVGGRSDSSAPSRLGLVVEPLTDTLRERIGGDNGVLVASVDGAAQTAGIQVGDVITMLDNERVDSVATFKDIAKELQPGHSVPVLVVRGRTPSFLALHVPDR